MDINEFIKSIGVFCKNTGNSNNFGYGKCYSSGDNNGWGNGFCDGTLDGDDNGNGSGFGNGCGLDDDINPNDGSGWFNLDNLYGKYR